VSAVANRPSGNISASGTNTATSSRASTIVAPSASVMTISAPASRTRVVSASCLNSLNSGIEIAPSFQTAICAAAHHAPCARSTPTRSPQPTPRAISASASPSAMRRSRA